MHDGTDHERTHHGAALAIEQRAMASQSAATWRGDAARNKSEGWNSQRQQERNNMTESLP
jgi:predicted lipoprotein